MSFLIGAGMAAAQTGMNLLTSQIGRERSIADQKRMANYNYDLEMKKWEATNYPAQVEQMKKAGLNTSLMYAGKAGQGGQGQITGGGQQLGGQVQPIDVAQMNSIAADIDLKKSQAELNRVEAKKKSGVDTENVAMHTEQLNQAIENLKSQKEGQDLINKGQAILNEINEASKEDQVRIYNETANKIGNENKSILRDITFKDLQNEEYRQTLQTKIEYQSALLESVLMSTDKSESDIEVNEKRIEEITNNIWVTQEELYRKMLRDGKDIQAIYDRMEQDFDLELKRQKTSIDNTKKMANSIIWSAGIGAGASLLKELIPTKMISNLLKGSE